MSSFIKRDIAVRMSCLCRLLLLSCWPAHSIFCGVQVRPVKTDQSSLPRRSINAFAGHFVGNKGTRMSSGGQQSLWSDCADAQTGLSLCWVHIYAYRKYCSLSWILFYTLLIRLHVHVPLKCPGGRVDSAPDFGLRGPRFDSRLRRNSAHDSLHMAFHYHPSTFHHLDMTYIMFKRDVKHETIVIKPLYVPLFCQCD